MTGSIFVFAYICSEMNINRRSLNIKGIVASVLALSFILIGCKNNHRNIVEHRLADSIYNQRHILNLAILNTDSALKLVDEGRRRHIFSDFRSNYIKAKVLYTGSSNYKDAMDYAQKALSSDSAVSGTPQRLKLLTLMSGIALSDKSYGRCIYLNSEGVKEAKLQGNDDIVCEFHFDIGQCEVKMANSNGFTTMKQAIHEKEVQVKDDSSDANLRTLLYFYGCIATAYTDRPFDNKSEAIQYCLKKYDMALKLQKQDSQDVNYIDRQIGYATSKLAVLYAQTGDKVKSEYYKAIFDKTAYSNHIEGMMDISRFLLYNKEYQKLLDSYEIIDKERGEDTISRSYVREMLYKANAYEGLGQTKKALEMMNAHNDLRDSFVSRLLRDRAFKLATDYQIHLKDEEIKEAKDSMRNMVVSTITLVGVILILIVSVLIILRKNKDIRRKNEVLARYIKEHNERFEQQNFQKELQPVKEKVEDTYSPEIEQIAQRLERLMREDKLYLDREMSREKLVKLLKTDKNRMAQAVKFLGQTSITNYVNDFRLSHACRLLTDNRNFTIQAIADESGYSSLRSFQRQFKENLGMTPVEYRENNVSVSNE